MKAINEAPLFKVLLPFLCGLIIALLWIPGKNIISSGFCFLALGFILYLINKLWLKNNYKFRWLGGFGITTILLGIGIMNVGVASLDLRPDFFAKKISPANKLLVQVTESPVNKGDIVKAIAKVKAIISTNSEKQACGNIILYIKKDSNAIIPSYGDQLLIPGEAQVLKSPANPAEFDYSRYMASQNIYHEVFLKPNGFVIQSKNKGSAFWGEIYNIRARLKSQIENALPGQDEKGIAEALIIGDESEIPNEIMSEYAGTGTLHILSVSGLHVAIILLALNWIFSFLVRIKNGKFIHFIVVLLLIWCYAFLTGFSPPIARSVIMFSLVYLGQQVRRQANIYNSICGAAFILLLIDPLLVIQAGFQLSFIALTGIVWLQPKISALWQPKHKFIKYVWELAAASTAAQIITFPISILYFNQLSLYFLPANLIIVPASFIVLGAGIVFVLANIIPIAWLHIFLGKLLFFSIYGLNVVVQFINHLPGANWQGLYINIWGSIVLYLLIFLIVFAFLDKSKKFAFAAFTLFFIFFSVRNIDIWQKTKIRDLNIFSVSPGHIAFTIKERDKLYVLADSSFVNDKQQLKYHVNGYAWQNYISPANIFKVKFNDTSSQSVPFVYIKPLILFHGKSILIIDKKTKIEDLTHEIHGNPDFEAVVLENNPRISLGELYKKLPFKSVIAAYGNDAKKTMEWETECLENGITFTNLRNTNFVSLPI